MGTFACLALAMKSSEKRYFVANSAEAWLTALLSTNINSHTYIRTCVWRERERERESELYTTSKES